MGTICATVVNCLSGEKDQPVIPEDFVPKTSQEMSAQAVEESEASWKADVAFAQAIKQKSAAEQKKAGKAA